MLLFNKRATFHSSSVMEPVRKVQGECFSPYILDADGKLMRPATFRPVDMTTDGVTGVDSGFLKIRGQLYEIHASFNT